MLSAKPGKLDALVEAVPGLIGKIRDIKGKIGKDKSETTEEDKPEDNQPENPGY